ncbi:hypothetical protein [Henriciella sp.]|uniref:hypothetical protein n=1 Tax=Henriciella sp. TaxID=1968823 RepID=UPI00261C2B38|nr:hypothetical protein [Henriciella sp.]
MPMAAKPISQLLRGETHFSRLEVIGEAPPVVHADGRKKRYARCRCECGEIVDVYYCSLLQGRTKSCGCYSADVHRETAPKMREAWTRHKHTADGTMTSEYHAWTGLKYQVQHADGAQLRKIRRARDQSL